jgi:hypothetical protein
MMNKRGIPTLYLGRCLAAAIVLSLALLLGGTIGLGMLIRYGAIGPPTLEAHINGFQIVAFITHVPECAPYTLCPGSDRRYYVVWSIYEPPTAAQPYGRTARRLLIVPMKR